MTSPQNQVVPRKRTFWKIVKTVFMPAQAIAKLMTGCGGGKGGKVKRRLSMRNIQEAKAAFVRASLHEAINRSNIRRVHSINRSHDENNENLASTPNDMYEIHDSRNSEREVYLHDSFASSNRRHDPLESNQTTSAISQLSAPLNIEDAQCLLESLTLRCQPSENHILNSEDIPSQVVHCDSPREELQEPIVQNNITSVANDHDDDNNNIFNNNNTETDSRALDVIENHRIDFNDSGNQQNRPVSLYSPDSDPIFPLSSEHEPVLRRSLTTASLSSSSVVQNDFNGWRRSSIEVTSNPPVTLAFIPSGLCVGDRIVWVRDDNPEIGTVRWIGKIRQQIYSGIEFDKPVGNSSGIYGYGVGMYKRLFTCQLPYGRFVPVKELVLYKDYHDPGVKSGIVCVICRDDFLDTWEPDLFTNSNETDCGDDMQPFHMVSTKCGHLYHWGCLDHWFNTKKRNEFHCPFCSRPMTRTDVIRIFPSQL